MCKPITDTSHTRWMVVEALEFVANLCHGLLLLVSAVVGHGHSCFFMYLGITHFLG